MNCAKLVRYFSLSGCLPRKLVNNICDGDELNVRVAEFPSVSSLQASLLPPDQEWRKRRTVSNATPPFLYSGLIFGRFRAWHLSVVAGCSALWVQLWCWRLTLCSVSRHPLETQMFKDLITTVRVVNPVSTCSGDGGSQFVPAAWILLQVSLHSWARWRLLV